MNSSPKERRLIMSGIENLSENQNSQLIQVTFGGFWRRACAAVIDGVIIWVISIPFFFFIFSDQIIGSIFNILFYLTYQCVYITSPLQTTPGKSIMSLHVVNEDNSDVLTFKAALIRTLGSYLSAMMMMLGYLIQPFTAKRQTFHDMIAGSVVIRKASDVDVNYVKVFINQFKKLINN